MTAAVGYLPRLDKVLLRRLLLHATEKGYDIVALAYGPKSWPGAEQMIRTGAAEVVVTTSRSDHTDEPFVEIAGAGRTTLRTYARATQLRRIADLLDSGLAVDEIVRILGSQRI